jgi:ribosome biogenesis ATPase
MIAATNRPDIIDAAMMRPGRLDQQLFVALPNPSERAEILKTLTAKTPLTPDLNLAVIAQDERAKNFRFVRLFAFADNSGADIAALVRQAAVFALKETLLGGDELKTETRDITVGAIHFEKALNNVRPSVSDRDRRRYEELRSVFGGLSA